jgi:type I restriction enzyme S subunit
MAPGYKPTEVGVIPEDWDVTPLSDLVTEFRGGAALRPSDFTATGIRVLPKGAVGRTGWLQLNDDDLQYCSPTYAATHSNNQVDETYTIVVLRDLVPSGPSIGRMVQIREPDSFVLAQGVYGLKVNQRANPGYLVQLSNTRWYRQLMNSIMVGSTQVHITNTAFKGVRIPLPSPPEQRAIATALRDVDGLMAGLDRLIGKKRDLKQATMQQLLTGRTRLPGFRGEWEVKPLGDICEIKMGRTPARLNAGFWGNGYPWLSIADLQSKVVSESKEEITPLAAGSMAIVPKGTLLMSFKLSIGRLCFAGRDLFTNEAICSFNGLQANAEFLYYELQRIDFSVYGKQAVKGFTLNRESLKLIRVSLPSPDEQAAIAAVLCDMDTELTVIEARLKKTRALKHAMMQELLTGKTRLI